MQILIVEDDPDSLQIIESLIVREAPHNSTIVLAKTFDGAEPWFRTSDLVVTDGRYPDRLGQRPVPQVHRIYEASWEFGFEMIAYMGDRYDVDSLIRRSLGTRLVEKPDVDGLRRAIQHVFQNRMALLGGEQRQEER